LAGAIFPTGFAIFPTLAKSVSARLGAVISLIYLILAAPQLCENSILDVFPPQQSFARLSFHSLIC
jgi:hypothetical protein